MEQPHPNVCREDVERIVRRDFPAEAFLRVLAVLDEYDQREKERVQLAVLKRADGREEHLRREIETAKYDFRDVLGPAEYPRETKMMFRFDRLAPEEKMQIVEADWKQYTEWLYR